ncbi:dioxygenase [Rhodopseudomonas palustris]|uniref:DODA-type extradiol aromatic ring-opening family dioxygenase n=1 Tax=Rhodopseudomonas palustris TaxID=1076 RepID=UPI00115DD231|nr:class III extradiol ring-cleavage dioxygenase [Rhodopseudomonas palustris]QDL98839.1 dioxygenase [Rhodopseudomonas palustris]
MPRQPTIFLSHGGGPCFWMEPPRRFGPNAYDGLRAYLSGVLASLPARPRAILIVSGHWEAALPTVSTSAAPSMLFDYYGFPEHTYRLSYPAPGDPALAARVQALLGNAGIATATDATRGFDHGVFVPMLIVDPDAQIPVVMLSLQQDLDPVRHLVIGAALAPLRDDNVLIIGSGNSFHNLSTFFDGQVAESEAFDRWLTDAATAPDAAVRNQRLAQWAGAPGARACHPREEHLIPLMVAAGAGGLDPGRRVFHDAIGNKLISGYAFG